MIYDHDNLREAFSLMASRSPADAEPNSYLEERLMAEATSRRQRSGRRMTLTITVCVLVGIAGTTVVAAGGVGTILSWFATAEVIQPDGTRTQLEVTPEGEIWMDETHSYQISPDRVDELEGRKVILRRAQKDSQPDE